MTGKEGKLQMTELSLNILDIVQNSVRAGAGEIMIGVVESASSDKLEVTVKDNGKGISPELLEVVDNPFTTTRSTRKTGLGIPLLKYHAELTGGNVEIRSSQGEGTEVTARFGYTHIDRQPVGDIAGVLIILISANPEIDFLYTHRTDKGEYSFSTVEARKVLETDYLTGYSLLQDLKTMIKENLESIGVSE